MIFLSNAFRRRLESRGYDVADSGLEWSLGYCQGDKVFFQGTVGNPDLVAERCLSEELLQAYRGLRRVGYSFDAKIERRHRYVYFSWCEPQAKLHELQEPLVEHFLNQLADLSEIIAEDAYTIGRELQDLGYKLLEAMNPLWWNLPGPEKYLGAKLYVPYREYHLGRIRVNVDLFETEVFDAYEEYMEDGDLTVAAMEAGTCRAYDLRLRVSLEDELLSEQWRTGVEDNSDLQHTRELRHELMGEAIAEIRPFQKVCRGRPDLARYPL